MYYSNGFKNSYEELITYYPAFYRDVFELRAILEANGRVCDTIIDTINAVIENSFVQSADEETITRLEAFLNIKTDKSRSLEERRRLVYSFFVGFGKVSASSLKETIRAITGAESEIEFKISDDAGNNTLYILIERGDNDTLNFADIETVLTQRLPAHINYKTSLRFLRTVVVGNKKTIYTQEPLCCGITFAGIVGGETQIDDSSAVLGEATLGNMILGYGGA